MELFDRLDKTLDAYADESDSSILNSSELDGFFHAIGCAPEMIPPSTWMPAIWGGEEEAPEWPDRETAQAFMHDIMLHYNRVMGSLAQESCTPLFLEEIREDSPDDNAELIPQDWCLGFQRGLGLIGDEADILAEELELITPIMVFSSEELEPRLEQLSPEDKHALIDAIPSCVLAIRELLGAPVVPMVNLGQTRTLPFVNTEGKVGRNEPCPCGSGKKFKKCCGGNQWNN